VQVFAEEVEKSAETVMSLKGIPVNLWKGERMHRGPAKDFSRRQTKAHFRHLVMPKVRWISLT